MPISLTRAAAHVEHWVARLPDRPWWPNHLFFAAHVVAAADILASGQLVCRRDLVGRINHDVANQEALGTNPDAHNFVRLYFRPRTHFHLRTEGIKLLTDPYRLPAHMSVPIMFVFDFANVITRAGVMFCERKMAHVGVVPGGDEAYFDAIDFDKVYHDRGISDPGIRADINDRRMAEVLVPDRLTLDGALKVIVCRTLFDKLTLEAALGVCAAKWRNKIRVAAKPAEMFFCWGAYVTEAQLTHDVLTLKVKTSNDYRRGNHVKFYIKQCLTGHPSFVWEHPFALENEPIRIGGWMPNCFERWIIMIEDALAFEGPIPVAQSATVVGGT